MSLQAKTDSSILLALECSGNAASAALIAAGNIVGFKEHKARHGHAETLISLVQEAVLMAGCPLDRVTHIAAGCGPGSFTGLRVCLSAAKGYSLALGAMPLGVSGLAALAYHHHIAEKPAGKTGYLSCADSRRNSVFTQFFDADLSPQTAFEDRDAAQLKTACSETLDSGACDHLVLCGLAETSVLEHEDFASYVSRPSLTLSSHQLNAADIGIYAAASLRHPGRYPATGFEPLYIAMPKLGSGRISIPENA